MATIDGVLHGERTVRGGAKKTYEAQLASLPLGTMFEHEERAFLVAQHGYLPWAFSGYGQNVVIDATTAVKVLTPQSVVSAFKGGFTPNAAIDVPS